MGDFYQISNQMTLGKSEEQLIGTVAEIIPAILKYERRARESLLKDNRDGLHDQISRAYALLRGAKTMTTEEALHLMVQSYGKLDLPTLRDSADRVLRANFPDSKYIAGSSAAGPRSWWQVW